MATVYESTDYTFIIHDVDEFEITRVDMKTGDGVIKFDALLLTRTQRQQFIERAERNPLFKKISKKVRPPVDRPMN